MVGTPAGLPETPFDRPPDQGARLQAVRSILTWALLALLVVLAATGVWLYLWYRPTPFGASRLSTASDRIRWVHRWSAVLALATAAVAAVLRCLPARIREPRLLLGATAAVTVALAVVAEISGYRLPWRSVALFEVTTGEALSGLRVVFRDHVVAVLIGSSARSPGSVRDWAITHFVVGGVAFLATAWLALHHAVDRLLKARPRPPARDASPPGSRAAPTSDAGASPSSSPAP